MHIAYCTASSQWVFSFRDKALRENPHLRWFEFPDKLIQTLSVGMPDGGLWFAHYGETRDAHPTLAYVCIGTASQTRIRINKIYQTSTTGQQLKIDRLVPIERFLTVRCDACSGKGRIPIDEYFDVQCIRCAGEGRLEEGSDVSLTRQPITSTHTARPRNA